MTTTTTLPAPSARPTPPERAQPPRQVQGGLLDPRLLWQSLPDALRKLDPRTLWKNPVMFIVEIGAVFTTVLAIARPSVFGWLIVIWLWLTVLFANLAEAVAEAAERRRQTRCAGRRQTPSLADWSIPMCSTGPKNQSRHPSFGREIAWSAKPET